MTSIVALRLASRINSKRFVALLATITLDANPSA